MMPHHTSKPQAIMATPHIASREVAWHEERAILRQAHLARYCGSDDRSGQTINERPMLMA